ncbi:MAG: hypothetical protein ABWX74_05555 [Aeromicrobium sp.]
MTAPEPASLGEVDLFLPADLFEFTTPEDPAEARREFDAHAAQVFGRMGDEQRTTLVDGIMAWREKLDEIGVVMHAMAAVPGTAEHAAAHWHFLAGVVDTVPLAEIDAGEVLVRYLATQPLAENRYTESYATAMGWGLGIITTDVLRLETLPPGASHVPPDLPVGIAVGLSGTPDGELALLVVGLCLDTEQTLDMASIVSVIAGESVIRPAVVDA